MPDRGLSEEEEALLDGVEEEDHEPGLSRTTRSVLAASLAVVMVSSILVFPSLFDVLLGLTQSDPLVRDTVTAGNTTVVFTNNVQDRLQQLYGEFPDEETALCMYGDTDGATYTVENFTQPRVYSSSYTHVSHAPCPAATIIIFHTHPQRHCLPSSQDHDSLRNAQQRNKDTVMMIMCEPTRFTIVSEPRRQP